MAGTIVAFNEPDEQNIWAKICYYEPIHQFLHLF